MVSVILIALLFSSEANDEKPAKPEVAVRVRLPDDPVRRARLRRAADWLKRHAVQVRWPKSERPLTVIAWKDPTLHPDRPNELAGYVITDTLWAAAALDPFEPELAARLRESCRVFGWPGNDLHEVILRPSPRLWVRPDDPDFVHGHSLGVFPAVELEGSPRLGRMVDLRVFRHRPDPDWECGHPTLFTEHAVYRGLFDWWRKDREAARRRLLGTLRDDRAVDAGDRLIWDPTAEVLIDDVTMRDWAEIKTGRAGLIRHFPFKTALVLYALRRANLENDPAVPLAALRRRLWEAQLPGGGTAHYVDLAKDGRAIPGKEATGESTAIAILAEIVEPDREPDPSPPKPRGKAAP